jgi:phosphatidylglycerol:prolipoprotein diacylglycerol transferase
MVVLLWISRRYADRLKNGDLMLIYLVGYPLGRFLLEFIRLDSAQVAGLNANQTIMGIVLLLAAGILILRHTRAFSGDNGDDAREDMDAMDAESSM